MNDPRRMALELLVRWEEEDRYLGLSLAHVPPAEKPFVTALVFGVAEHRITLDYSISALAGRSDLDPVTRQICRLGLCQLRYLQNVPAHAAVDLTVGLARNKGEAAFVNAILRTALRSPEKCALPDRAKNPARYLSLRYSLPQPTVKRLLRERGEEITEAYLAACERPAPLSVTVNTTRVSREELLSRWQAAGIGAEASPLTARGILVAGAGAVTALPGFDEGLFFVQDEAARLAVEVLSPAPGDTVADVCAAPGGKSFAAALSMSDRGEVVSLELHESKLPLIRDGAARLGLSSVHAAVHDGTTPRADLVGRIDRVICDVPCSGLGVLRKKPDIRYKDLSDAEKLPLLQRQILDASAAYVRAGGRLLYATCTLLAAENEGVTDAFLAAHPDFSPVPFRVGERVCPEGRVTLWPQTDGCDGFYFALLQKEG